MPEYHFQFSVTAPHKVSAKELERRVSVEAVKLARAYHSKASIADRDGRAREYAKKMERREQELEKVRRTPPREGSREHLGRVTGEELTARQQASEERFNEWAKGHPLPAPRPSPWSKAWWEK
jgi:hypothetical protein